MISVDCDGCGKEINSRNKVTKGDTVQYNYECECGKVYFITILEGTKAYPAECDCCDGSCKGQCDDEDYKQPICPICADRHFGVCNGFKREKLEDDDDKDSVKEGECLTKDDVSEPVPRADAIVSLPYDFTTKKCAAPETISMGEIIHTMELKTKRLKLEKEILDLDEYLYHARERERLR